MPKTRSKCVKRLTLFGIKEHFPLSIITVRKLHARFNYLRYTEHNNFDDTLSILVNEIEVHYRTVFSIEPCCRKTINEMIKNEMDNFKKFYNAEHY